MSELPLGWASTPLDELGVEVRETVAPVPATTYELWSVPAFATGSPEIIDGREIGSAKRAVRPHDVLICKINPRINRVWLVAASRGDLDQIASPEYLIFRTRSEIVASYLRWYLSSPSFRAWIELSVEGATGSHTRAKSGPILRQIVPLPPLAEQRRIVAAIEEQFSRLDEAERSTVRAGRRIDALRRAATKQAFDAEWPDLPLVELTPEDRPICYGILMPKEHVDEGVPYVRVRDFPVDKIDVAALRRTTMEIAEKYRRSTLRPGDVLVSIRGTFGRVAIVPEELAGANITQDTARISPGAEIEAGYLAAFLRSEPAQRYFRHVARGVAVKGVNIGDLRLLPVPLPSPDEQRRIVAQLEQQLSLIDSLRAAVETAQKRSRSLRRAILERAFRGELVPQDPDDEPASVLLERIRAERAAAPSTRHKRRAVA